MKKPSKKTKVAETDDWNSFLTDISGIDIPLSNQKKETEIISDDDIDCEFEAEFSDDSDANESAGVDANLTPFERYLEKQKKKRKERIKTAKEAAGVRKRKHPKKEAEIPVELLNDPFYREQMKMQRKEDLMTMTQERENKDKIMSNKEFQLDQRQVGLVA